MQLWQLDGKMGNGKTLGMSLLALYFASKSNCTLYSNYGLEGSKPFSKFSDFLDVAVQPSSIVCLDEVHNDLDSRDYATNSVKFFTHLVFYLRKMRCTLMMTSPLFSSVEGRVRGVTNIYTPVSKNDRHYIYPCFDYQSGRLLKTLKIDKTVAHDLSGKIFNTFNMVEPLEYPSSRQEFQELIRQLKSTHTDYLKRSACIVRAS